MGIIIYQLKWLPFKKLVQLHSIRLMYCQYHHTKCIPLLPPIEFGPHHSHYDTRTAAHFANSKRLCLTFSQNFFHFTASQWWNNLPTSLHSIIKDKCIKKFYNGYMAYLFSHVHVIIFLFCNCCLFFCVVLVFVLFLCLH